MRNDNRDWPEAAGQGETVVGGSVLARDESSVDPGEKDEATATRERERSMLMELEVAAIDEGIDAPSFRAGQMEGGAADGAVAIAHACEEPLIGIGGLRGGWGHGRSLP